MAPRLDIDDIKVYSLYRILKVPKRFRMPKAIGEMSPRDVINIQSYWTNMLSYLHVMLADKKSDVGMYNDLLEHYKSQQFVIEIDRATTGRKTKEYIYAKVKSKPKYTELFTKLLKAKRDVESVQSMVNAAERIISTASRDQSWRQLEYEKAYGRGGQGTG
jgi:hypothetical protein